MWPTLSFLEKIIIVPTILFAGARKSSTNKNGVWQIILSLVGSQ